MSGTARSNIVPMMPQGQMMPMPQGQMMSSFSAGCCPPGGDMSALLQCYCDVQAATAFISKVVTDLAANDPAFQKALVDGIAASGSNLPLIGVTNGSQAQPGQVGEYVEIEVSVPYTAATQTQTVTMGILQPGDWDVWQFCSFTTYVTGAQFNLAPVPAGFSHILFGASEASGSGTVGIVVVSAAAQASISVPTLVVFSLTTNGTSAGPAAGTANMFFCARRRR